MAADAEIGQDAVDLVEAGFPHGVGKRAKSSVVKKDAIREGFGVLAGQFERLGVAVVGYDDAGSKALRDEGGMTGESGGTIQIDALGTDGQQFEGFGRQDWDVRHGASQEADLLHGVDVGFGVGDGLFALGLVFGIAEDFDAAGIVIESNGLIIGDLEFGAEFGG